MGASSGSEVSLDGCELEEGASGRLELPQEQESLNDSVRRLQLSVEEYCPEQLQFAEKVYNYFTGTLQYCYPLSFDEFDFVSFAQDVCSKYTHTAKIHSSNNIIFMLYFHLTGQEKGIFIKHSPAKN